MYEDRACEKITERNFVMLSSKYQKEQIELEQQITSLREELSKMEQDMIGAEKWIELIKEYSTLPRRRVSKSVWNISQSLIKVSISGKLAPVSLS